MTALKNSRASKQQMVWNYHCQKLPVIDQTNTQIFTHCEGEECFYATNALSDAIIFFFNNGVPFQQEENVI